MKNILSILCLISLFCTMCKKDETGYQIPIYHAGVQDTGWGEGFRDGKLWESTAFARKGTTGEIGIAFNTFSEFGELRENLTLVDIPPQIGSYLIKGHIDDNNNGFVGSGYGNMGADGDLAQSYYEHNDLYIGNLKLSFIDTISKVVEGSIDELNLKKVAGETFPEQVKFTNIKFSMKIID